MTSDARPSPFGPILLAWLVPGAGHLKLGRPWPALFIATAILPLFVLGMYLTGWENVSWTRHPYYFGLQAPAGLVAVAGEYLTRGKLPDELLSTATVGTLYSAVAGLLNLMAIADVWARTMRGDPAADGGTEHADGATAEGTAMSGAPSGEGVGA